MRLQQFLNEGRTKKISAETFYSKINNYMEIELYRHIDGFTDDYGIVNPSNFERESAYAYYNYYTLLIDNLPSWRGWPKRSKSIVCTTSMKEATDRAHYSGAGYEVYPKKGSKIAICPSNDIWFSFHHIKRNIGTMNDFNRYLNRILFEENGPKTYKEMLEYDITIDELKDNLSDINYDETAFENLFVGIGKNEKIITGYFNRILDPDENGFKLITSEQQLPYNKEVWTDGECLVKKYTDFNDTDDDW